MPGDTTPPAASALVRANPCPGIQRYAALYNVSQATAVGFPGCARRPLPGRLSV